MRLTQILYQQHLGRMIQRHWYVQTKVKVVDLKSDTILRQMGIPILDPNDVITKPEKIWVDPQQFLQHRFEPIIEEKLPVQEKELYTYNDSSFFIQGQEQAQALLKTVCVEEKLPEKIEKRFNNLPDVNDHVKRIVRMSTIFDAHQEKLPKQKHPTKLMWNFPRDYGITPIRKTHNLCYKLLNLCELVSEPEVMKKRTVISDGLFSASLERESDLLQIQMTANLMVTSSSPLSKISDKTSHDDKTIPDISPSHPLIGWKTVKEYKLDDYYPIKPTHSKHHLHTIFLYYDLAEMKNVTERPVQESQILARSLAHCFTAAASYAKQRFGDDVKDLPKPVTVQCVQCDGQQFHFSVYQLNTLNLDGTDGLKNFWWSEPRMSIYEKSGYENGTPIITGYNPDVFKRLLAFYRNS